MDEWIRRHQAEAMRQLKGDIARAERLSDPVRLERQLFVWKLARARYRQKLSQSQLAAKLKMRQSDISRIENGKANPGLTTLLKIAKALRVELVVE